MEINDRHELYNIYVSVCSKCKHFDNENLSCKAFENGIPDVILSGEQTHDVPTKDQVNDIVFESK